MTNIFLQRQMDPPLTDEAFAAMIRDSAGCLELYRVQWRQSLLSTDGRRLVCWFDAPDAESARQAMRKAGESNPAPWPGTIHDSPASNAPPPAAANVAVERSFEAPVTLEEIQAIENAGAACLETRDVRFVRTFFSRDRRRMVCLYRAPDAEAVRQAQRMAKMPLDSVWAFQLKE